MTPTSRAHRSPRQLLAHCKRRAHRRRLRRDLVCIAGTDAFYRLEPADQQSPQSPSFHSQRPLAVRMTFGKGIWSSSCMTGRTALPLPARPSRKVTRIGRSMRRPICIPNRRLRVWSSCASASPGVRSVDSCERPNWQQVTTNEGTGWVQPQRPWCSAGLQRRRLPRMGCMAASESRRRDRDSRCGDPESSISSTSIGTAR